MFLPLAEHTVVTQNNVLHTLAHVVYTFRNFGRFVRHTSNNNKLQTHTAVAARRVSARCICEKIKTHGWSAVRAEPRTRTVLTVRSMRHSCHKYVSVGDDSFGTVFACCGCDLSLNVLMT